MSLVPAALSPKEHDIKLLLACEAHIGSQNVSAPMQRYVWRRRADGVNIINISKTWEKLILAARLFVTIDNPADIAVISGPQIGQRAVLKFASFTGASALSGRFTPGTFTNQIQEKFVEPRLLIVTDPRADHQAITESSYVNLPTIAFCNTDAPVKYVDVVIPCNNRTTESIGLMYWLLAREILYLKGALPRSQPWDVMVDIFFFRPPEEIEEKKALEEGAAYEDQYRPVEPPVVHEGYVEQGGGGGGGPGWEGGQPESWAGTGTPETPAWVDSEGGNPPVTRPHVEGPPVTVGWEAIDRPIVQSAWDSPAS